MKLAPHVVRLFAVAAVAFAGVSDARAQEEAGNEATGEVWARLFNEAVTRMADGAFDEAAELFERSYLEGHRSEALFNRALALSRGGHHVAAHDVFATVLVEHAHELDTAAIQDVVDRRNAEAAQTGTIQITMSVEATEILVDDVVVGTAGPANPLEVRVDAGSRSVRARVAGSNNLLGPQTVQVVAGSTSSIHFVPPESRDGDAPIDTPPFDDPPETTDTDGPSIALVVGLILGGVALIAGGVVLAVWAANQPQDPYTTEPYGSVSLLRW